MTKRKFLTIAGRYRQSAQAAEFAKLPERERTLALIVFYAGFAAALEATKELAEFDEDEALEIICAMAEEAQQFAAVVTRASEGKPPS